MGYQKVLNEKCLKTVHFFCDCDHLEATRGRLRELEAVFKSYFDHRVLAWGIKHCRKKMLKGRLSKILRCLDHLFSNRRGPLRDLEAYLPFSFTKMHIEIERSF